MEVLVMCLIIFSARTITWCMGTFRLILIIKNRKLVATVIAFFEALIWFIVIREAMIGEISSILIPISYASGFAFGTFLGLVLTDRFVSGFLTINAISSKITNEDIQKIKAAGFGISSLEIDNNKKLFVVQIDKKDFNIITEILKSLDNEIFIMTNETRHVYSGFIK